MSSLKDRIFSISKIGVDKKQIRIFGIKVRYRTKIEPSFKYEDCLVEENKIVFRTIDGGFSCNPKYIANEIINQNLPYKLVWVVNKNILNYIDDFDREKIKLVMQGSEEDIKETSTAKIIVDNERRIFYIQKGVFKRKGQIYIQTFHGSLGIKKTGIDRGDYDKNSYAVCVADAKQIDYLISNSKYETDFFKKIFFGYGKILEYGHPRNDPFFEENQSIKEKVYKYFNIQKDKKIVLYAPTLRENRNFDNYDLDFESLIKALNKKFNSDFVVLLRYHPLLMQNKNALSVKNGCINATKYNDMQELLLSSEILITDYSSCIYDFMLSKKIGFIFASDVKEYENGRGLYYPLSTTPFSIAQNNDEMIKNIENFNYEIYKEKVDKFLKEKGCIEDGKASKRVVELIKNLIKNKEKK